MSGIGPMSETPPLFDLYVGPADPRASLVVSNTPTLNMARLAAFTVSRRHTVTTARMYISTSSGNLDVGVYSGTPAVSMSLVRLASSGATASPGTGNQNFTIAAGGITLLPGITYWVALAVDNTTIRFATTEPHNGQQPTALTLTYMASAYPLPDPITSAGASNHAPCVWLE